MQTDDNFDSIYGGDLMPEVQEALDSAKMAALGHLQDLNSPG